MDRKYQFFKDVNTTARSTRQVSLTMTTLTVVAGVCLPLICALLVMILFRM